MISGSAACAVMMWALAQAGSPPAESEAPAQTPPEAAATPSEPTTGPSADDTVRPENADILPPAQAPEAAAPPPAAPAPVRPEGSVKPKPTRRTYLRRPNTISFNVAQAFFGSYALVLERALGTHASLVLEPSAVQNSFETARGTTRVVGFEFAISARYFPFGEAPDGLFVAPEFSVYNLQVREAAGQDNGTSMGGGVWAGYNHTLFNLLHLSAGVGYGLAFGRVAPSGIVYRGMVGLPLFRANVGFAF